MKKLILLILSLSISCAPVQLKAQPSADTHPVALISFSGDVDQRNVDLTLGVLNEALQKGVSFVVIEWNTRGGEVEAGFRLVKAIENMSIPVVCVVDGEADSMGFYLLQACPVRLMTKRSVVMLHEAKVFIPEGLPAEIVEKVKAMLEVNNDAMVEHYAARMCKSAAQIRERIRGKDWWMAWREAFSEGAIDGVVLSTRSVIEALQSGQMPVGLQEMSPCSK